MSKNFPTESWIDLALVLILYGAIGFLLFGCASGPPKPKTHTQAPSLATSKEISRTIRSDIADSKDAISNARRLRQTIDNKLSTLQDWK